jgi:Anti-sigma factor NepR
MSIHNKRQGPPLEVKEKASSEESEMKLHHGADGVVQPIGFDSRQQAQLGQKLKAMFDAVANAPVPDKFLDLLSQLERREGKSE